MKINKLVGSLAVNMAYVPLFCRGADPVSTAVITSTGLIGDLVGTNDTNATNRAINRAQMEFNAREAEKQRQFQKDEWTRQYELQREEWYNQLRTQTETQYKNFLRESEYNSPENQMKRLQSAGINPSAVLSGSGGSGLVSAATGNISSAPTPSVPSGGSVSGSAASAPSAIPVQKSNFFANIGTLIRDLAAANKDSKTVAPLVDLLTNQALGEKLSNDLRVMENEVFSKIKSVKVKREFLALKTDFVELSLKKKMGENVDADTVFKKAQAALAEARVKCSDKEYESLCFAVDHLLETWTTQQNLDKAKASEARANAGLSSAKAQTENENRKNVIDLARLKADWQIVENGRNALDFKLKDSTYAKTLELTSKHLVQELVREDLLTSELSAKANLAIKEKRYYELINIIGPTLEHLSNKQDKAADRLAGLFDDFIVFFK